MKFVQTWKVGVAIVVTIITTEVIVMDGFQHVPQGLQVLRTDEAIPSIKLKSLFSYKVNILVKVKPQII